MVLEHEAGVVKGRGWVLGQAPDVEGGSVDDVGKGGLGIIGDVFFEGFGFKAALVKVAFAAHKGDAGASFA